MPAATWPLTLGIQEITLVQSVAIMDARQSRYRNKTYTTDGQERKKSIREFEKVAKTRQDTHTNQDENGRVEPTNLTSVRKIDQCGHTHSILSMWYH